MAEKEKTVRKSAAKKTAEKKTAKKDKEVKEFLSGIISDLFAENGVIIVREVVGEKYEICGFEIMDDKVVPISAEDLKRNTDLQPDGSIKEDEREVFVKAPLIFPNS